MGRVDRLPGLFRGAQIRSDFAYGPLMSTSRAVSPITYKKKGLERGKKESTRSPTQAGSRKDFLTRQLADLLLVYPPTAQECRLATSDAFVDQDFDFNPTIVGSALRSLIRCGFSVLAHCAWRNDMPYRHFALLHQKSNHGLSAVLAEFCIHLSVASGIGIAHYLNDVPFEALCGLRQLFELLLVLGRDLGAPDCEFDGGLPLHVIIAQRGKALRVLLGLLAS